MNEDKLRQIQKLLSLSKNNDSLHEAAAAFKTAQRLMEKYRISEAMLESLDVEAEEEIEKDILHSANGRRLAWWKRTLSSALATVNGCKIYTWKEKDKSLIMIVGEPSDAATVRYMYNYIANEIDRLTKAAAKERGSPGKTWCNSFRIGAVDEVSKRLHEAREEARDEAEKEAEGNSTALVRVASAIAKIDKKTVDAKKWMYGNVKGLRKQTTRRCIDKDAKKVGQRAGSKINISSGGTAIGKGTRGYLP